MDCSCCWCCCLEGEQGICMEEGEHDDEDDEENEQEDEQDEEEADELEDEEDEDEEVVAERPGLETTGT